jgi:uncharacterized protein (DUF885 family)
MTTTEMLADDLVEVILDEDPLFATLYGIRDRDSALRDLSVEAARVLRARAVAIAARARALDETTLPAEDRVTRAVIEEQAAAVIDRIDARAPEYTVTDLFVAPAARVLHYLPRVPVTGTTQASAYVSRLAQFGDYLATAARRHLDGAESGRLPVSRLVRSAIEQLAPGAGDALLAPLRQDGLEQHAEQAVLLLDSVIRPALAGYRTVLAEKIAPLARGDEQPGLCWITGGESIYAGLIRVHTGTTQRAEQLHQIGKDLVAGLEAEYARSGAKVFGTTDTAEIFHRLRSDPRLRWNTGREMLDAARVAITKAEQAAPDWFTVIPDQRCVVEAVPPAQEGAVPSGTYLMPSPDGKRPGTFFTNTSRPTERFRHVAEVTAFHEGVPGHHLQVTRAHGLTGLPMLRRLPLSTAYVEGWGLYSERLADEMGLYSDELSRLGMLVLDSMRAVRLVVDTGLHANGWSRAEAVDYMRANTAMPDVEIEAEVSRYIADAGQALAYMVGRLEIDRIRATAESTLGDRFDVRAFHDTLLGGGPLPLAVLADVVAEWAATA